MTIPFETNYPKLYELRTGADPGIFNREGAKHFYFILNFNDQKGTPKIFCIHFQKVKSGGGGNVDKNMRML